MASQRQYATIAQVEQFADITSTDNTEFEDRISQAEQFIDSYVGFQQKAVPGVYSGKLTSASSTTLYDTSSDTPLYVDDNYFSYCVVEIIGGTGIGQTKRIVSSSKSNYSITIDSAFTVTPDSTSVYKIFQLGKFPRVQDVWHDPDTKQYSKSIPDAVMVATCAQLAYAISKGDDFFSGDMSVYDSETIGNYSYSKGQSTGQGTSSVNAMSPRARALLKGFKFSGGKIVPENPTWL